MKKVKLFLSLILVFSTFILNGCHQTHNNCKQEDAINLESPENEVEYREGVYHDKKWETPKAGESDYSAADKETAVSIACAEFKKLQQGGVGKNFVLRGVFFDTEDEVWIVYFSPEPLIPGSAYNIAISKQSGEILNMWPGE